MERARLAEAVAQNISAAIAAAGVPFSVVAEAADLTPSEFKRRLVGDDEFNAEDVVKVSGFLHVSPLALLKGVAA